MDTDDETTAEPTPAEPAEPEGETAYLLRSPANARRLLASIASFEAVRPR